MKDDQNNKGNNKRNKKLKILDIDDPLHPQNK